MRDGRRTGDGEGHQQAGAREYGERETGERRTTRPCRASCTHGEDASFCHVKKSAEARSSRHGHDDLHAWMDDADDGIGSGMGKDDIACLALIELSALRGV